MKPTSKISLYCLYAIIALFVFLYLRFPSDLIKEILMSRVQQAQPDVQLEMDEINPIIPPGVKLEPLLISYADMPVIRMDKLKVRPHLFSLIGNQKRFSFKGSLGDGELIGRVETDTQSSTPQSQIKVDFTRIPLAFIEILEQFKLFKINGEANGRVNFDSTRGGGTAEVSMDIAPVQIVLDPAIMDLKTLDFHNIKAQLTVSTRAMQIRNCDAFGDQLEGRVTGSIVFRQPIEDSKISLSLTIKPQPAFLAEHRNDMIGGFLSSDMAQKRGVVFRISGTFKNPNYVIR